MSSEYDMNEESKCRHCRGDVEPGDKCPQCGTKNRSENVDEGEVSVTKKQSRGDCKKCGVHDPLLLDGLCDGCNRETWKSIKKESKIAALKLEVEGLMWTPGEKL